MVAKVFISYKAEDYPQAEWVKKRLEAAGFFCWIAPDSIPNESNYTREIPQAISSCDVFVLILSKRTQTSKWISRELDRALMAGKRVMPFVIENCPLRDDYAFYLTNVQQYKAWQNPEEAIANMIRDIKTIKTEKWRRNSTIPASDLCQGATTPTKESEFGSSYQALNRSYSRRKINLTSALMDIIKKPFVAAASALITKEDIPNKKQNAEKNLNLIEQENHFEDELSIQSVQFSAIAPIAMIKGESHIISLLIYEDDFKDVVDRLLLQSGGAEIPGGALQINQQSEIMIHLTSRDITIDGSIFEAVEKRPWKGKYQNFSFAVFLPPDYDKQQILFRAEVYINGVIASSLNFIVSVNAESIQTPSIQRRDFLSAFISYASEDRSRVAAIIQGMQKARPDLDIFLDVENLRSGEQWEPALKKEIDTRDIFYLCWSLAARKSSFVELEWKYALNQKGLDRIEPIPIDPPAICPPPAELSSKHFNDRLLYLIRASEM